MNTQLLEEEKMAKRQKPRNLHACHPIMKKGGVHEKSKGAQRAAARRETRRKASEWPGRSSIPLALKMRA